MRADAPGTTTLIAAGHLVGIGDDGGRLADAAVVLRNGRIAAFGAAAEMRAAHPDATAIERPGHVLCPGLIDARGECGQTLLRGAAADVSLNRWQRDVAGPARQRWENEGFVRDATALALVEYVSAGVTCVNDASTYPDVVAKAFDRLGVRGRIGIAIEAEPSAWAATPAEAFELGLAVRDRYRGHDRLGFSFAAAPAGTLTDDTLRRLRTLSDQLDEPVQIPAHQTRGEIQQCLAAHAQRPLERLRAGGLVSPALLAIHANHLDEQDIDQVASGRAHVVHCPQANLRFAGGRAPVVALRAHGVNMGLGSAGAALAGSVDLFAEMRCAAMLAKDASGSAATLTAGEALHMATLGGARALGLDQETGSIAVGKWADLICVDLNSARTQPVYDPVSTLVWSAGPAQVSDVWVAGRALVREHTLTAADAREIVDNARAWARNIGSA